MTGDDHDNGGTAGRFDNYISMSPSDCSVQNWECIRGTSYIYPSNPLSNAQASSYNNAGFEVALHVNTNCADFTPSSLESFVSSQLSSWSAKYTSLPLPVTNRTHCIAWSDYTTQPRVELNHGIRFDTNYYYWPPAWVNNQPGFFTGSGIHMRFADSNGNLMDVFQAPTQMTDESGQTYLHCRYTLTGRSDLKAITVLLANAHTDVPETLESDAIVSSAPAREFRDFSTPDAGMAGGRYARRSTVSSERHALSFTINVGQGANGLSPWCRKSGRNVTGITRDGTPVSFASVTVKGITYVRFTAANEYQSSHTDIIAPVAAPFLLSTGNRCRRHVERHRNLQRG
jgi:hypothetical protein